MSAALWLLLCVSGLGLLAFPLTAALFRGAPLGGWPLSRVTGLLLLTLASWGLAALAPGPAAFPLALGLIASVGGALWLKHWRRLAPLLRPGRELLLGEALFAGLLLGLALLRGFIADTTARDKYQDMVIINALALAPQVPPPNPWFAGQSLNYYYLGHWSLAALSRVTGIDSLTVFLLAIPLTAALAACGAWYLARAGAAGRPALGALAVWMLLVAGTPAALGAVLRAALDPAQPLLSEATVLAPVLFVRDPAPVPGTLITEFPAFTFLYADVHAHALGVPYLLLALALLGWRLGLLGGPSTPVAPPGWYAAFGVVLGAQYAINAFDFPLVAGLFLLGEGLCLLAARERRPRTLALAALAAGGTLLVARLALWNFYAHFTPFTGDHPRLALLTPLPGPLGDLFAWTPVATGLGDFLALTGFVLVPLAASLVALAARERLPAWLWLAAALALPLALWRPVLAVTAPLLALTAALLLRASPARRLPLLLALAALGLWSAPEVVMIRDIHFFNRSNTLFKWYFQAYILLAVALPPLVDAALGAPSAARLWLPARAALGLAAAALSAYTAVAALALVVGEGGRWWGLGGTATLAARHPDEAAAISWLRAQPDAAGVVEAVGKSESGIEQRLRPARVSSYTGRQTLVGWDEQIWIWDNIQQRPELQDRINDLRFLAGSVYKGERNGLMAACAVEGIGYIYVGALERAGGAGAASPAAGLERVYDSPGVQIYRCPGLAAGWGPADALYGQQGAGASAHHWARSDRLRLRLRHAGSGPVALTLPLASTRPGNVTVSQDGGALVTSPVGPQRRILRLLLDMPAGGGELEVTTDLTPAPLSEQDRREGTLLLGLPAIATATPGAATSERAPQRAARVGGCSDPLYHEELCATPTHP